MTPEERERIKSGLAAIPAGEKFLDKSGVRLPGASIGVQPNGAYADLQRRPDDTAGSLMHRGAVMAYDKAAEGVGGFVQGVADPVVKFGVDAVTGVPNSVEKGRTEIAAGRVVPAPTTPAPVAVPTISNVGEAQPTTSPTVAFTADTVGDRGVKNNQNIPGAANAIGGSAVDMRTGLPGGYTRVQPTGPKNYPKGPISGYEVKGPAGTMSSDTAPSKTPGSLTIASGPLPEGMDQDKWDSLSQGEASAIRTKQYEDRTKALKDARMERTAAMDGREYDPTTGRMKGADNPPLVIGQTGGFGILDNDYQARRNMRMTLDDIGPNTKKAVAEAIVAKAATYAPKDQFGDVKLKDLIDMQQLQETGRHNQMRELNDEKDRALVQRRDLMDMGYKEADLGLRSQTAGAQMAESQQKLSRGRQEELEAGLAQTMLPKHVEKYARGAAARFTGVPTNLLLTAIQRAAATQTDAPDGLWGAMISGKKKTFGDLNDLSQDEVDSTGKVIKQGGETAFEAKVREQLAGMMK
jgi:hypothetical protein